MSKTKKLPFKISARTARLIGRQNFPNSEGAIIELVKNSYDADASICIVIFDNRYSQIPEKLTQDEYKDFVKKEKIISNYYSLDETKKDYLFKEIASIADSDQEKNKLERGRLQDFFRLQTKIYIIDNGEGMTNKIIEDYWMTIGTNNKEVDIFTKNKRVKTGAKGIGRFALDKLGDTAEVLTKPNPKVHHVKAGDTAFMWQVNWESFDGDRKTLDKVKADLIDIVVPNFSSEVEGVLPQFAKPINDLKISSFKTGTKIEIGNLRDIWDEYLTGKLFANLEVLIPPREEREFDIFLFSTLSPQKYGRVAPSICDDYDYKLEAHVDINGIANITVYRNEFDLNLFQDEFFEKEILQEKKYTKSVFKKGKYSVKFNIDELVPGLKEIDEKGILSSIGEFDAVFYFMKATAGKTDREVFLYKTFSSAARKVWLDQFGGIKLFRDNFRVRPYGEVKNAAFDWLQLGERAARSPNSIGQQRSEPWKVRPNQISGIINISRVANISFEDTSSRYGLQENTTFRYFTQIILGILQVFEKDRSDVGKALRAYYDETHKNFVSEDEADDIKERVRKNKSKQEKTQAETDSEKLLDITENLEEKIEELKNESNLLRILASNSLVIASFTHELVNIKDNLVFRVNEVKKTIAPLIDEQRLAKTPDFLNPFVMLEGIKHDDEKLREWLRYSFETLRRDKRQRKNRDLLDYFKKFKEFWRTACENRGVELVLILPDVDELRLRVFEAELDSIFNNLLINSFEAFLRKGAPQERKITIKVELSEFDVYFTYLDSGPGLSKDIVDPARIFEPHFTTKKDAHTGEDIGTGLGMWIVKAFVSDYNGTIDVLTNRSGFGVLIKFMDAIKK
jgi:signal transduction histidine kinase